MVRPFFVLFVSCCCCVLTVVTAAMSPSATLIPAYFYPSGGVCGGTLGYWDCVAYAARTSPAVGGGGIVIVNPGNGPGTSFDSNYGAAINATLAAGDVYRQTLTAIGTGDPTVTNRVATAVRQRLPIQMAGYIRTGYGSRAASAVLADASTWTSFYNVSSFFLDECTTAAAQSSAFIAMATQVRAVLPPGGLGLVCNFGTIPDLEAFISACDVSVVHEDYASNFYAAPSAAWMSKYPPSRFAVLYHTLSNATQMRIMMMTAAAGQMGASGGTLYAPGYVYVTDKPLNPNPWDSLPSFWWSEMVFQSWPWAIRNVSYSQGTAQLVNVSDLSPVWPRYVTAIAALLGTNGGGGLTFASNNFVTDATALSSQSLSVANGVVTSTTSSPGFVLQLWAAVYSATIKSMIPAWFADGTATSLANAIVSGVAFTRVTSVADLQPGDVLVLIWSAASLLRRGDASSGYVAVILNVTRRPMDSAPIVAGTTQFDVCVADSTMAPHGSTDRRAGGGSAAGIGTGCLRLYANTTSNYSMTTGLMDQAWNRIDATNASFEWTWSGMAWSGDATEQFAPFNDTQYLVAGRPLALDLLFDLDAPAGSSPTTSTLFSTTASTTALSTTTATPSPTLMDNGNGTTTFNSTNQTTAGLTAAPFTTATAAPGVSILTLRLASLRYTITGTLFANIISSPYLASAVINDVMADLNLVSGQVAVTNLTVGSLIVNVDLYATNASTPTAQVKALQTVYITALHDFPTVRALYRSVNTLSQESLQTATIQMTYVYSASTPLQVSSCNTACGAFIVVIVVCLVVAVAVTAFVVVARKPQRKVDGDGGGGQAVSAPPTAEPHLRAQPQATNQPW